MGGVLRSVFMCQCFILLAFRKREKILRCSTILGRCARLVFSRGACRYFSGSFSQIALGCSLCCAFGSADFSASICRASQRLELRATASSKLPLSNCVALLTSLCGSHPSHPASHPHSEAACSADKAQMCVMAFQDHDCDWGKCFAAWHGKAHNPSEVLTCLLQPSRDGRVRCCLVYGGRLRLRPA
jgi:hypothetical protein